MTTNLVEDYDGGDDGDGKPRGDCNDGGRWLLMLDNDGRKLRLRWLQMIMSIYAVLFLIITSVRAF